MASRRKAGYNVIIEVDVFGQRKTANVRVPENCSCPVTQAFCYWRDAEVKSGNYHAQHAQLVGGR